MSELLLTACDIELITRVRAALEAAAIRDIVRSDDPTGVLDRMDAERPLVVAIGPAIEDEAAISLAGAIERRHPDVAVVLLAQPTSAVWEQALRAGIREIVAPDASPEAMRNSFERAMEVGRRRQSNSVAPTPTRSNRVIAVVSPKGGAGKTLISTNLAIGLAQRHPHDVVIIDLDLQFGDVGNALRLVPDSTISDTVVPGISIDTTSIKAFLTPHPTDLLALCAPKSPADADEISPKHGSQVIELLAHEFTYVIIDTSAGLDEWTLAALECSTDIILVSGTDVASARSARKALDAFDLLGITSQQRHFVQNRADSKVGLSASDIESTLGTTMDILIPSSRSVPISMNQGVPILESQKRTPVSKSLVELLDRFSTNGSHAATPVQDRSTKSWRRRDPR